MTNINTTATQKIGRRAARRAQAQQTVLMHNASLTPSQIAELGVKLEELNKLYDESDGEVRNSLASDIANISRMLMHAKAYNTDPLIGILLDDALSAKIELADKKDKATLDLWRYRQAVVTGCFFRCCMQNMSTAALRTGGLRRMMLFASLKSSSMD